MRKLSASRTGEAKFLAVMLSRRTDAVKAIDRQCQGKVEMSCPWQSRNVAFPLGLLGVHVNLRVPVKRRRAMLASNPIKE